MLSSVRFSPKLLLRATASPRASITRHRGLITTAMAQQRVHYDSKTCPYAQRSWIALVEKGLPFEIRKVDLANKDDEFVSLYRSIAANPEAGGKVPILIDVDGTQLLESNVIVEYLEQRYPEPRLLPADAAQAAKVRLFIETFSSTFPTGMFGLMRAGDAEALEAGKAKLVAALKVLNSFLLTHGGQEGGDFFLGGTYSMAETCTTSFVQRGVVVLPAFRDVDLFALVQEHKLDRLERWMRAALDRPSAKETSPDKEGIVESLKKFVTPIAVAA